MKSMLAACSLLVLAIVVSPGCSESPTTESGPAATKVLYKSATLCGACGQIKGSEACCAEGAEKCAGCSLHKGAPGCCKMEAGTEATLCAGCGQIKGSTDCCADGAEVCAACGLHKGAPGCCKLEKIAAGAEDALPLEEEKTDSIDKDESV